ncbi:hypothetical protein AM500_19775 [Bacillus sp. FJAT-18017]|uniref:S41 family peptidase n=1 Tax=Bacillus sp. FJAT-18017 TaxID=1705566 RepID=UPI0006AFF89D|nr:S41 family peptidase [Bacillus sp. FJAT-18017]ALC91771.1 hypothetical protein AM500_19775 [Bacillus sp. FJAT-18017]
MNKIVNRYIGMIVVAALFAAGMMFLNKEAEEVAGKPAIDKQLENIEAFGRLYGAVRFFHPSDEAAAIDWTRFAIYGVGKVKVAGNEKQLKEALEELFLPIAPTLVIYEKGKKPVHPKIKKSIQVLAWQHYGPPGLDTTHFSSMRVPAVISEGEPVTGDNKLFEEYPPINKKIDRRLSEGLRYSLPVVLYQKDGKTVGSTTKSSQGFENLKNKIDDMDPNMTSADEDVRLAGVVVTWNQLSYFHPHVGRAAGNLEDFGIALKEAFDDKTRADYLTTLAQLMELTEDGHAMSSLVQSRIVGSRIPLELEIVEGELTITAASDGIDLKAGDIVETVNGHEAIPFIEKEAAKLPGSPQFKQWMAMDSLLFLEELKMTVNRNGAIHETAVSSGNGGFVDEYGHNPFQELEPGIFYIHLAGNVFHEIEQNLDELSKAKGIVFDARGGIFLEDKLKDLIGHLTINPVQGPKWKIRQTTVPGENMATFDGGHDTIQPLKPFFQGKLIFLASKKSYGPTEQLLSFVKNNRLAKIVGEQTAGMPGEVQTYPIPGNIKGIMTGVEISQADGTPIYGVGIKEDITVTRTFIDVKAGTDEYLQTAMGLIR